MTISNNESNEIEEDDCLCSRPAHDALHELESGLHRTDEIPWDYQDPKTRGSLP